VISHADDAHSLPPASGGDPARRAAAGAIIAALMTEEVRRLLLPLPDDCALPPDHTLRYQVAHPHRRIWSGHPFEGEW